MSDPCFISGFSSTIDLAVIFRNITHTVFSSAREWSKKHSLIAMRQRDTEGNPIMGPGGERPWFDPDDPDSDSEVHIITVFYPNDPNQQILRIIADSETESRILAEAELRRMFFGNWAAVFSRSTDHAMSERLNREHTLMREFISKSLGANIAADVASGKVTTWKKRISPNKTRNTKKR